MPKLPSTDLFDLIRSMTAAEKRYFKLGSKSGDKKQQDYYILFSLINKQQVYDENELLDQLAKEGLAKHLPFKKIHLHTQILESLNNFYRTAGPEEEVLNLLQNLKILYDRGLYWQSEKLVKKIEKLCIDYDLKEYRIVLLKWQKIMTLHMQNAQIAKKLDNEQEKEMIRILVEGEEGLLNDLKSNIDVWEMVIKVADTLRMGINLDKKIVNIQGQIEDKLKNEDLTFISKLRLYHSKLMLSFISEKCEDTIDDVYKALELWDEYPKMKTPYFRNHLVTLNIALSNFIDMDRVEECEPILETLLTYTHKTNKDISFINKCKAYAFYYKNYLGQQILKGSYQEVLDSYERANTRKFYEHFELFKKSQVHLLLTVANYFLENYKKVGKSMVLSQASEETVQKIYLSEIRIIYYCSLFRLSRFAALERTLNSNDQKVQGRLNEFPRERTLIDALLALKTNDGNMNRVHEIIRSGRNAHNRIYLESLVESLN
jgi:hypothetical protein